MINNTNQSSYDDSLFVDINNVQTVTILLSTFVDIDSAFHFNPLHSINIPRLLLGMLGTPLWGAIGPP